MLEIWKASIHFHNAPGLSQNHFHQARIFARLCRDSESEGRRLDFSPPGSGFPVVRGAWWLGVA